jgi:hypothetical protein
MKRFSLFLVLLVAGPLYAQLTVTSTSPVNNATNVPAVTTISLTFSAAIDTSILQHTDRGVFTNIDTIQVIGLSGDKRTISFAAHLTPGRPHYITYYYVKGAGGVDLTTPYIFYFTTAASFPTTTVSGTVVAGTSGVDPAGCLVVLATGQINEGQPNLAIGTISTTGGAFTIPYVTNGGYYPIATKDVDHDGSIDPGMGIDPIVQGDSITVSGSSITGITLPLSKMSPMSFREAYDTAMVCATTLPSDRTLKMISCYDPDTLGFSQEWNFDFTMPSQPAGARLRISPMEQRYDSLDYWSRQTAGQSRALTNVAGAAELTTFMTNCENAGGRAYRIPANDSLAFHWYFVLGDARWNEFWPLVTDTSKNYWSATYWWGTTSDTMWNQKRMMRFLGNFQTGVILRTTDVRPSDAPTVPDQATLSQNFPNPFNPSTVITFSIPATQEVSLSVVSILGQQVDVLADGMFARGNYDVRVNGERWPSGIYFCVLRTGGATLVSKMVLLR